MTTRYMTDRRIPLKASFVLPILNGPDMSKVIRRPPVEPRGGDVYVYSIENNARRDAWRNDNIHFHHDGTRGQPKSNPVVRKVFFCAMTANGRWTRNFRKHVYTLYHNPNNFVVIHYLGNEAYGREVPRHRKPRSNTKKHTTCSSTAVQVETAELCPLTSSSEAEEEDQILDDVVHDEDDDDYAEVVELSEPMVEIGFNDDDSGIQAHELPANSVSVPECSTSSSTNTPSSTNSNSSASIVVPIPFSYLDMMPITNPLGLLSEVTLSCQPLAPSTSQDPEPSTSYASQDFNVNLSTSKEDSCSVIPKKRLAMRLRSDEFDCVETISYSSVSNQSQSTLPKKRRLDFDSSASTSGQSSFIEACSEPTEDYEIDVVQPGISVDFQSLYFQSDIATPNVKTSESTFSSQTTSTGSSAFTSTSASASASTSNRPVNQQALDFLSYNVEAPFMSTLLQPESSTSHQSENTSSNSPIPERTSNPTTSPTLSMTSDAVDRTLSVQSDETHDTSTLNIPPILQSTPVAGSAHSLNRTITLQSESSMSVSNATSTPRLRHSVRHGFQERLQSLLNQVHNMETLLEDPDNWEKETRDVSTETETPEQSIVSHIRSLLSSGQLALLVNRLMQLSSSWRQRPGVNRRFNPCMSLIQQAQEAWPEDLSTVRGELIEIFERKCVAECDIKNFYNLLTACVVGAYRTQVTLNMFLETLDTWPRHLGECDTSENEIGRDVCCIVGRNVLSGEQLQTLEGMDQVDSQVVQAYIQLVANHWSSLLPGHVFVLPQVLQQYWTRGDYTQCMLEKETLTDYTYIVMPYRASDTHWVLLVANVQQRTVTVVNTAAHGYPEVNIEVVDHWRKYMKYRSSHTGQNLTSWTMEDTPMLDQTDGNNSGVMVMMAAESVLCGVPPAVMRSCHVRRFRQHALNRLLTESDSELQDEENDDAMDMENNSPPQKQGIKLRRDNAASPSPSTSTSSSINSTQASCSSSKSFSTPRRKNYASTKGQDKAIDFSRNNKAVFVSATCANPDSVPCSSSSSFNQSLPKEHNYAHWRNDAASTSISNIAHEHDTCSTTESSKSSDIQREFPQPPSYSGCGNNIFPIAHQVPNLSANVQVRPCDMTMQSQLAIDSTPSTSTCDHQDSGVEDLSLNSFRTSSHLSGTAVEPHEAVPSTETSSNTNRCSPRSISLNSFRTSSHSTEGAAVEPPKAVPSTEASSKTNRSSPRSLSLNSFRTSSHSTEGAASSGAAVGHPGSVLSTKTGLNRCSPRSVRGCESETSPEATNSSNTYREYFEPPAESDEGPTYAELCNVRPEDLQPSDSTGGFQGEPTGPEREGHGQTAFPGGQIGFPLLLQMNRPIDAFKHPANELSSFVSEAASSCSFKNRGKSYCEQRNQGKSPANGIRKAVSLSSLLDADEQCQENSVEFSQEDPLGLSRDVVEIPHSHNTAANDNISNDSFPPFSPTSPDDQIEVITLPSPYVSSASNRTSPGKGQCSRDASTDPVPKTNSEDLNSSTDSISDIQTVNGRQGQGHSQSDGQQGQGLLESPQSSHGSSSSSMDASRQRPGHSPTPRISFGSGLEDIHVSEDELLEEESSV